jgi:4-hydroxy-tetrahydrodipicolinate synthase
MGTTGEGASLALYEREQLIELVMQQRGEMSVIAGTGAPSLPETITLSRFALEQGVDAVLVTPPFYFKYVPEDGVLRYYRALCDALPENARVILYHIPQVTDVTITPGVVAGLRHSHPRQLYGLKDSSGDASYLSTMIRSFPDLHVFVGNELMFMYGLQQGCAGLISAAANVWPDLVHELLAGHQSGADTQHTQEQLSVLSQLLSGTTPPLLKAALPWRSELPFTSVRVPLTDLSENAAAALRSNLRAEELL